MLPRFGPARQPAFRSAVPPDRLCRLYARRVSQNPRTASAPGKPGPNCVVVFLQHAQEPKPARFARLPDFGDPTASPQSVDRQRLAVMPKAVACAPKSLAERSLERSSPRGKQPPRWLSVSPVSPPVDPTRGLSGASRRAAERRRLSQEPLIFQGFSRLTPCHSRSPVLTTAHVQPRCGQDRVTAVSRPGPLFPHPQNC